MKNAEVFLGPCQTSIPVGIYVLKVNNGNSRTRCEIYSKLIIKTSEGHAIGIVLVFLLLTLNTYFIPCSNVSIVSFEHAIADWNDIEYVSVFTSK